MSTIRSNYQYTTIRIVAMLAAMLFLYITPLAGQYSYLYRRPIYLFDLPNSLEGNEVQDIIQDSDGYMWFASKAGLVRYDGTNFKLYDHDLTDSTSISNNAVEVIKEDSEGNLWIATWGGGLNKFDRRTERFIRYEADPNTRKGLSNNYISELALDDAGFLWIATRFGLNRLDLKTETFTHFLPIENDPTSLSYQEVRTLYIDQEKTLWVGTGYPWESNSKGGLNRYHPETESFTRYQASTGAKNSLRNNKITALFEDDKHNFWVGSGGNHIYLMDRAQGTFEYLEELSQFDPIDTSAHIRSFTQLKDDNSIWICSYGDGIKNYHLGTKRVQDYLRDDVNEGNYFYALNQGWKIYQSRDGTIWVCTGDIGDNVFKSDLLLPYVGLTSNGDPVQAMYANDKSGDMWFGRRYNGLVYNDWNDSSPAKTWMDDPRKHRIGSWSFQEDISTSALFDNLFAINEDSEGLLWFAKFQEGKGLYRFNPETGDMKNFRYRANDDNSPAGDTILDIAISPDAGQVWFVTSNGILHCLDKATERITRYDQQAYPNCPSNASILEFSKDGSLWLGSVEAQQEVRLTRFYQDHQSFTPFSMFQLPQANPTLAFTGLLEDSNGQVWLGSEDHLFRWTPNQGSQSFALQAKQVGRMYSMVFDEQENIWMATNRSISVFNTTQLSFFSFPPEFPLPAMPFSFRAAERITDNDLLFCGLGGGMLINSATQENYYSILENPERISAGQIVFTSFSLNGKEITEGEQSIQHILETRSLSLTHEENNFSVGLSLLDFKHPDGNYFEYFLDGYDKQWRKTGDQNMAYYSQIPPGNYELRVKGFNANGAYGEAVPIAITILPPWWLSWWAYLFYIILFTGIIYSIYRFQLSRQLANSEARRLQELDAAKSQLYTNITHEFRTPLTVILGMAKQLEGQLAESQNLMVEMIDRNGQNLLNLVNQMLDLAKLESGQMSLHLQQSDIMAYLKYLVESFHSYAESREVKIHFLSDLDSLYMDFDPNKFQQIISNLLSNAIKFTPSGGDIYLTVNLVHPHSDQLLMRVKDTGVGIPESRLPHIFKRFYQADDTSTREFQGTGIGLALVAELVKLMRGEISAKSELNKGTEISVVLPIQQEAQRNTDHAFFSKAQIQLYREGISVDAPELYKQVNGRSEQSSVLIVEDNHDVRSYIQACLADKFQLYFAENGQKGVDLAMEHIPDLVISDVMMPLKDGFALVQELKTDQRTSHIPIILLTAKADINSKLQGLRKGADAYLAKPFNPKELLIRIHNLLDIRQQLQAHYRSLSGQLLEPGKSELTSDQQEDEFVQHVKAIIYEYLDDPNLDVQQLCREIGMSHSQLHRKLSALTGLSTNRFIRHVRLAKAKQLLLESDHTITAIAFDTGFNDPSYFGRVFKRDTGMTPLEWQKKYRKVVPGTGETED